MKKIKHIPRLVVLELTRRCNLSCIHCRANAQRDSDLNALKTEEWLEVIDDISSFSRPIIILSGGEPLLREDVFEIIRYAQGQGLVCVLATCGAPLTEEKTAQLKQSGIKRISVSIDGKDAATHNLLRQDNSSFETALRATGLLKKYGIEFQINTTITKHNFRQLEEILNLAIHLGAASFHPFFMVPVGRASQMSDVQLTSTEYEWTLNRLDAFSKDAPIHCRPICAPHYFRVLAQKNFLNADSRRLQADGCGFDLMTAGCLGGKSFAFISSQGKVQICGFLEVECGDIRKNGFSEIWQNSTVFNRLRNFGEYKGKCGGCEYLNICGGCRARAYEASGDYLEEEPECVYQPLTIRS